MSPTPGRTSNAFSSAPMGSPLSISGPSSNPHVSKDGRAPSHVSEPSTSVAGLPSASSVLAYTSISSPSLTHTARALDL
jgi:hypothetical protein